MKEHIGSGRLSKIVYVAGVLRIFCSSFLSQRYKVIDLDDISSLWNSFEQTRLRVVYTCLEFLVAFANCERKHTKPCDRKHGQR